MRILDSYNKIVRRVMAVMAIMTMVLGMSAAVYAEPKLLEPDDAFRVQLRQKDKQTIVAQFDTAKDYHLYKEKIRFTVKNSPGIDIQSIRLPAGIVKTDPNSGRVELLKDKVEVEITLQRAVNSTQMTLVANYQGCEEKVGVCYPPIQKELTLALR
jgi:thiol:disulfide interchange protein